MWELWINLYHKGGIMMVPLFGCSVLTVILIVERALVLRQSYLFPIRELEQLRAWVSLKSKPMDQLKPSSTYPVGRILAYGLSILPASPEHFKEALFDQARRERHYLERGLVLLEIIAGIAPLLGLLGTVLGMITIFDTLALEGPERTQGLSYGISEALITTVAGLCVAIPALIGYTLFSRKIDSLGLFIEEESMFFYYRLFGEQASSSQSLKPTEGNSD